MLPAELDPWRLVLAIAVVGAILLLAPRLLRRFGPTLAAPSGGDALQLVASRSLDVRHRAVVVRFREVDHLIVIGGDRPVVLPAATSPGPEQPT